MDKETLRSFAAKHDHFVGFDSDGCIFDSMELKHKECFIPNIIKYYDLQPIAKYAREVAEFVNLYSQWRGTNRFPALVKTIELLRDRPEVLARGVTLPDLTAVEQFIRTAPSLGNPALEKAIEKTGDSSLKLCLEWSRAVNVSIEWMVKGLPPFPAAKGSLEKISGRADTMVVSATPAEALRREWEEHGIDKYVGVIAGQELGKKEEQLGLTAQGKYKTGNILMVGDALGDLKAAQAVHARFYPIVPGREDESWERFRDDVVDRFLRDAYPQEEEDQLCREFSKALPSVPPWKHSEDVHRVSQGG
ncbi:MAG TPA: HAD family hydrolase [Bacteroidota bacterium]|nr:HAD family hydrolase [Bacteroidota bacterium]